MNEKCDVRKAAITLGLVFALYHLLWIVLVAMGGSDFVNWVAGMHFVWVPYTALAFDIVTLIIGLVGAFVLGAVTGAVFAYIWNSL